MRQDYGSKLSAGNAGGRTAQSLGKAVNHAVQHGSCAKIAPACILAELFVPRTPQAGADKSICGSCAVRAHNASTPIFTPGRMAPPRSAPRLSRAVMETAVSIEIITQGRRIVGQNCNGAAHQFAAKLGGIICPDGKPGFEARPCDIDASRGKVVQRLADTGQHRGHNAGKNDAGNIPRLRPPFFFKTKKII